MPDSEKTTEKNSEATPVETEKVSAEIAVRKNTWLENLLTTLFALFGSIVGGIAFVVDLFLLHVPITNLFVFLFVWLVFPVLITTLAVYRNQIVLMIFSHFSSETYLKFAKFWEPYRIIVALTVIILFFLGYALPNSTAFRILPLIILGFFLPIYYIFGFSLTSKGEIRILFENLRSNLHHFFIRNIFWEQIAGKIVQLLENGNIEVSKDDLIYYFNAKLWETKDNITIQLSDIEAWLLYEKDSCFDSLTQIIPKECFRVGKRKNLLRNIVNEPTTAQVEEIKVLGAVAIVIIFAGLILIHPELGSQIISHLPTF